MNSDILKTILKIKFLLKKKSQNSFIGSHRSAFRGTGVDFSDFREYSPGDDVRSVSWPLTAKMGKPYIKVFEEDRGSLFVLMLDVSASSWFGTRKQTKKEVSSQLASLIALSAEQNKDQVSLLLFSDQVERYIPPSKGRGHIFRLIQEIYQCQPKSKKTQFKEPCRYLERILKKRSYIFILSDFMTDDFESSFQNLSRRHEAAAVIVQDPLEKSFPPLGLMDLEDAESGKLKTVDSSSSYFQKKYSEAQLDLQKKRETLLKKAGVDYFYVNTNEDIFKPFISFMQKKKKRKR